MSTMKHFLIAACLGATATLSGCLITNPAEPPAPTPWPTDISKKDAADLMKEDPANAPDYCDINGWYDDGVCDDFCYELDSDCDAGGCTDSRDCATDEFCGTAQGQCGGVGSCQVAPDACDTVYDPVCGCDGQTYGNACSARSAGASVAHEGPCEMPPPPECTPQDCGPAPGAPSQVCEDGTTAGPVCQAQEDGTCGWTFTSCPDPEPKYCGGLTPDGSPTCDADEYCHYEAQDMCGAADAQGICKPRPEACTEEYAPVCGCDGQTHGNACSARAAGVSVASIGECGEPEPKYCGGLTPDGSPTCDADEYCHYEAQDMCGAADAPGVCKPRPEACTFEYAPVCGCDGQTYGNACEAQSAGVSVMSAGECGEPTERACGGFAGETCGAEEYCHYDIQDMCGAADAQGTCKPRPQFCTEEYAPVCGCDGQTYGNECAAQSAGVSAAAIGECGMPVERACGGFAGETCGQGEYCHFEEQDICGFADAQGVCKQITNHNCLDIYDPVCGCDGQTYGNACSANSVGMSVHYSGECMP